jgi:antitoxin (DNA-binding transcriptional repressor) of toxin-antitoxin stability system
MMSTEPPVAPAPGEPEPGRRAAGFEHANEAKSEQLRGLQLRTPWRTEGKLMDYVTVRELREKSGEIWQRVDAGEEFVVTRNGKPFALLLRTEPSEVESALRAHRAARFGAVVARIQAAAASSAADQLGGDQIQAEIDEVRRERARIAPALAEPAARPQARARK